LLVFALIEVGMFVAVLVLARHKWFAYDDWEFIAGRKAGSVSNLFRPTIGHWMTLPILVFRGLFGLVGLRTYLPYVAVLVVLHLTAAALVRTVMRRIGVGPWVATVAASLFVLFGAGYENIIWAVQISFVGSLVLGLVQLLLASHDGPIDRRDWLGLLAGAAGLMCSGVAVIMAIVVGMVTLARRGWRVALFHTAPLAALYAGWWFGFARHYYQGLHLGSLDVGLLARWVERAIGSSFGSMGQLRGAGIAIGVVLVVGLALAWSRLSPRELRTLAATPAALLVGAAIFAVSAGSQRQVWHQFKLAAASDGRYTHIIVAMVLPAIAVAATAVIRRWRLLMPVALAPLVIGIPDNLHVLANPTGLYATPAENSYRQSVLALASVPVAHAVPRSLRAESIAGAFAPWPPPTDVTIGWLLDQKAAGRLPAPGPFRPTEKADATLLLALHQSNSKVNGPARTTASPTTSGPSTPIVGTANSPALGPILVDSSGRTLYTLTDGIRPVACGGGCGVDWQPLLAPAGTTRLRAGPGVAGLGTAADSVVTDWGYPLYRFSGDKSPNDTNGVGLKQAGAVWQAVPAALGCSSLTGPVTHRLEKGQSIGIEGGRVGVIYLDPHGNSDLITFTPTDGNRLVDLAGPLTVELLPAGRSVTVCM
jgi:predicted lipoprotein with Yx(FWY)xxD motif